MTAKESKKLERLREQMRYELTLFVNRHLRNPNVRWPVVRRTGVRQQDHLDGGTLKILRSQSRINV